MEVNELAQFAEVPKTEWAFAERTPRRCRRCRRSGSTPDLAAAGVETTTKGFIKVNDRLETNVSGIWVSGGEDFNPTRKFSLDNAPEALEKSSIA